MPLTLVETPGSASANTYGTLAEAEAYFAERLGSSAWTAIIDDEIKKRALITAARKIDQQLFRGRKPSAGQALQWPRAQAYSSGFTLDSTEVPTFVKQAQFEEAFALLVKSVSNTVDPLAPSGTEAFKSIGVGDIRLEFKDTGASGENARAADDPTQTLSPAAYGLLRAYLITDQLNDRAQVRSVRIARG